MLLEALTLGRPIIATDIPGNRHVLETCGFLVPNDQAGLEAGLEAFIAGKIPAPAFDPLAYQAQALADFDRVIGVEPA